MAKFFVQKFHHAQESRNKDWYTEYYSRSGKCEKPSLIESVCLNFYLYIKIYLTYIVYIALKKHSAGKLSLLFAAGCRYANIQHFAPKERNDCVAWYYYRNSALFIIVQNFMMTDFKDCFDINRNCMGSCGQMVYKWIFSRWMMCK